MRSTRNNTSPSLGDSLDAVELPDYGNDYRVPFTTVREVHDERGVSVHLVRVDPATEYGMSRRVAQCIQRFSSCIGCGQPPFPPEAHKRCTRDARRIEEVSYWTLRLPGYRHTGEFVTSYVSLCQVLFRDGMYSLIHDEIRLDYKRANKFLRKVRQPKMPKRQLIRLKHELLLLHEGHCYYCFAPIEANEYSADFDHFEPIVFGGTGDIWNFVVTCKKCNHDKGAAPGEVFRSAMLQSADKPTRRALGKLQLRVDVWRETQLQEHRSQKATAGRG